MPALALPTTDFDLLRAENDGLRGQVSSFSAEVKRLSALVEKLTFQLALLKRLHFGQKSEALSALMGDLFGEPTSVEQAAAPVTVARKASREPKAEARITLPPNLPVEETVLDLPEDQKITADGTPLKRIGEEVSDRLAIEPGRFYLKRTIRPKYADPKLPEQGVCIAALPARIIDGGLADESVYADILIGKFDDHLPLHRIGGRSCASMRPRHSPIPVHRDLLARWSPPARQANPERLGIGLRALAQAAARGGVAGLAARSRAARR